MGIKTNGKTYTYYYYCAISSVNFDGVVLVHCKENECGAEFFYTAGLLLHSVNKFSNSTVKGFSI